MRMNRIAALTMGAGMITMAACSDAPTAAPSAAAILPKTTSFVVAGGVETNSTPVLGQYKICKEGNIGGSFDVTRTAEGASSGTVSGLNTVIPNGKCWLVAEDAGGTGVGSNVSFTEDAQTDVVSEVTGCTFIDEGGGTSACAFGDASRFINSFHGFVVTVTNTHTPPPPPDVCTYTKGWYQNKNGEPTIIKVDDREIADQIKIFNASPGQPGSVKWGVAGQTLNNKPNNLLNLYQQLLAALNNLDGDATGGPDAVDQAISDALAATGGSGTNITVAAGTDISGLISVLSAFNEGQYKGYPHCGDEVLTN